jgi:hypothetical protein
MGLSISSLINKLYTNELEDNSIFVRKIKPISKKIIKTINKSSSIIPNLIYNMNKNNSPTNENLGVVLKDKIPQSNLQNTEDTKYSTEETEQNLDQNYLLFCVLLDHDVIGYIKLINSQNEDIVKQNQKKINDFIKDTEISYLRELGFSNTYSYTWLTIYNDIKIYNNFNIDDIKQTETIYKSILIKKGKNIPVAYDRKISTLKIKKIYELC